MAKLKLSINDTDGSMFVGPGSSLSVSIDVDHANVAGCEVNEILRGVTRSAVDLVNNFYEQPAEAVLFDAEGDDGKTPPKEESDPEGDESASASAFAERIANDIMLAVMKIEGHEVAEFTTDQRDALVKAISGATELF